MASNSSDALIPTGTVLLHDRRSWPTWYLQLQFHCMLRGIWEQVDPEKPDQPSVLTSLPEHATLESLLEKKKIDSQTEYLRSLSNWQKLDSSTRGTMPTEPTEPDAEAAQKELNEQLKSWSENSAVTTIFAGRHQQVWNWVNRTVDSSLLASAQVKIVSQGTATLQAVIRALKTHLAPSHSSAQTTAAEEYRATLAKARSGGIDPLKWHALWHRAFLRAQAYDLSDVNGVLAAKDFLNAVGQRMAPDWASRALQDLIRDDELGRTTLTLEELGAWFIAVGHEGSNRSARGPAMFTTLEENPATTQRAGRGRTRTLYECPCRSNERQKHVWRPTDCVVLEQATKGSSDHAHRLGYDALTPKEASEIRERLQLSKWAELRSRLSEKGWLKAKQGKEQRKGAYPQGPLTAFFREKRAAEHAGVFSTVLDLPHQLSQSTLIDNCGASHLVNTPDLLVPGSFKKAEHGEVVEAGTTSFPISGRGTRVLKNVLNGARGPNTEDLVLSNVVVVEGFHVNIISEARLEQAGVWYLGLDCSLRYGPLERSVVVKQLERRHNLVFIEYKPLSTYSSRQNVILVSDAGLLPSTLLAPIWRRSAQPLPTREDSEQLWHLRSGHLGPDALRALVWAARGVRINGTTRIRCEHCARAHATQVVSRRASEDRAPRPFWRISWDLFDFPRGLDGSNWLLVIKDEYSGMLFARPLKTKSKEDVFPTLRDFASMVRVRYGLSICKIRQDRDTSVISAHGTTDYEAWCAREGIEIELTPSYTHEPNGGGERAGQEVVTKSIKMRTAANLPERLWPYTSIAATYLYNRSPRQGRAWRSPCQVLEEWFAHYFRWYAPQRVNELTADLRPDWGNTYAYGCRAYPLTKDREAERRRRAYKVEPRAHIGYLVSYAASNIYLIWVPVLDQVITTRNVVFDEQLFFVPEDENDGLSERERADILLEITDEELPKRIPVDQALGVSNRAERQASEALQTVNEPPSIRLEGSGVGNEHLIGLPSPQHTPDPSPQRATEGDGPTPALPDAGQRAPADEQGEGDSQHEAAMNEDSETSMRSPPPEEGPTGDTIVVRTDPPPRATQTGSRSAQRSEREPGTRASRRQRRLPPESSGVFNTMLFEDGLINVPEAREWSLFFSTFMPDQQKALNEGDRAHKTLHAVLHAAVQQHSAARRSAGLTKETRLHRSELLEQPPNGWKELQNHPAKELFVQAAHRELRAQLNMGAWRKVERSAANGTLLPFRWVFAYKWDKDGFLERGKARLCVRGDMQPVNTLQSTYAATLAAKSFRIAMAIAARYDLEIEQFDVVNAFLHATLEGDPVYCELPDGFKEHGKCAEVRRALYGLRDAPLLWYNEFTSTLRKLGLTPNGEEECLFQNEHKTVTVVFYVDDYLVIYHKRDEPEARKVINGLQEAYEVKAQGAAEWYLGVRILRDRAAQRLYLVHDSYIEKIAKRFDLTDGPAPSTPLPGIPLRKFEGQAAKEQVKAYQERVGSILYTAIMIRADVAFAAAQLSLYLTNPGPDHLAAADQSIAYLYATRTLAIRYGSKQREVLVFAADASFADDEETRRSSHGYTVRLFGGLVHWRAARQDTVTTSTTEAELLGVAHAGKELMALKRLLRDLAVDVGSSWDLYNDNQQTIRLIVSEHGRVTTKLRHVDIHNMWLKQEHAKGAFRVQYLPTELMPADGLTKSLSRAQFEHFRRHLNLFDAGQMIERAGKKHFYLGPSPPETSITKAF